MNRKIRKTWHGFYHCISVIIQVESCTSTVYRVRVEIHQDRTMRSSLAERCIVAIFKRPTKVFSKTLVCVRTVRRRFENVIRRRPRWPVTWSRIQSNGISAAGLQCSQELIEFCLADHVCINRDQRDSGLTQQFIAIEAALQGPFIIGFSVAKDVPLHIGSADFEVSLRRARTNDPQLQRLFANSYDMCLSCRLRLL